LSSPSVFLLLEDSARNKEIALQPMNTEVFHYYNRLEKVRLFVEENYSEEISLQKAANVACMERTSFSRFFGSKVGISFTQWLRRIRIAKAKELMRKNNLSIMEITYAVGFSNLRTFERVFKQLTDLTPSQFKKSVRPH
jgi:transcriptional regulator GlxA family with amidase domain